MAGRKRILFVGEAVSLAHVTCPLVLAQALDPHQYEVHFACSQGYDFLFEGASHFTRWPITTIPSHQFLRALARGARLYERPTLEQYVEEDVRLLKEVRPDLVVGDFRISLSVSSAVCGVPYAALANAHWSPFTTRARFPLPEHALEWLLGVRLATALFHLVQPVIFRYHAQPMRRLRRRHGLPPLGSLLDVYTHGDHTLYLDLPSLAPTRAHLRITATWAPSSGPPTLPGQPGGIRSIRPGPAFTRRWAHPGTLTCSPHCRRHWTVCLSMSCSPLAAGPRWRPAGCQHFRGRLFARTRMRSTGQGGDLQWWERNGVSGIARGMPGPGNSVEHGSVLDDVSRHRNSVLGF